MFRAHPLLAGVVVIGFALLTFWRVRIDYAERGKLTLLSTVLEFGVFTLHGAASYSFLDSRLSEVKTGRPIFAFALALIVAGLLATFAGMGRLSWGDTVGRSVTGLRTTGPYRFTRNPQLVAYSVFLAGYALLWPPWLGLAWLGLYGLIAHLMVLTEEGHLQRVFGREDEDYCRRMPRYLGLPRRGV